jgi:DNA-binding MarR family transcriptional regulator
MSVPSPAAAFDPVAHDDGPDIAAWRALLLAQNTVLRAIEADLERAGCVPLSWYDVLLELNGSHDHRLRMQELASRTVLSRTRVSRLVDDLVVEGYVSRASDPADGRVSFAVLTPTGRAALRKAAPVYLAGIRSHFTDNLTATERNRLVTTLGKVVAARQPRLEIGGRRADGAPARTLPRRPS